MLLSTIPAIFPIAHKVEGNQGGPTERPLSVSISAEMSGTG